MRGAPGHHLDDRREGAGGGRDDQGRVGFRPRAFGLHDGRVYPEGKHSLANLDALCEGRGVVTAVEVSRTDCEGLRQDLTRLLTHPDKPARNYGLMKDPAA